ncbi:MAG: phosphodiesterase [Clostridia bacterium]|nr:phosphodiesterase [Clostridia bacterium]
MKHLIISDIHGDITGLETALEVFRREGCDKLLILGDVLYHGPRNDLPEGYAPKKVIAALNPLSDRIIAVRGNCDAEVDQMVLSFDVTTESRWLDLDGIRVLMTHGHKQSTDTENLLKKGEILLHGHTHVLKNQNFGDGNVYINPGSVSLPKEGNPKSYIIYCDRAFTAYDFDGRVLFKRVL